MKGMRTYLAGVLSVVVGLTLILAGQFHPPAVVEPLICLGLIVAGLATMGVRGIMGAKSGK
jgi:uncharacterized membrane-anchored protein